MRQITDYQYRQFTPEERSRLTMAALARGDIPEAERLWETCPKYTFNTHDLNYTERVGAIITLQSIFFEQCVIQYNLIVKAEIMYLIV